MCGIVILNNGKLVYENYIGFSSIENETHNHYLTKFRIGSITKIFTAIIIFQLIEEGRLALDTKLSEFYPQITNSIDICIAAMLGHRSGIQSFTDDPEYPNYMTSKKSKEEMLKLISNLEPDFRPDEKYAYSNSNYVLLGYIIEEMTNSTYEQQLKQRITEKLNLTNTAYGNKIDTQADDANSYRYQENRWNIQPETDMSIPHGAGAIISTPNDLVTFISSLFGDKLITDGSLIQMKEINNGYGKGLIRFPFGNRAAYGHNGVIDGFVSLLAFFPDDNVALSVLANGMNYNFNDMLIGILSIYFDIPFEIPNFEAKEIEMGTEELTKYAGEFSSKQLPLKISLKTEGIQLYGQATGQSAFPLTPYSKTEFRFEPAGIVIEFKKNSSGKIRYDLFILNQGGEKFTYERQ